MNTYDTYDLAKYLGITITLKPDTLKIVATPRENITPEMREAITENLDDLVKDQLCHQALDYVSRITSGAGLSPREARSVFRVFDKKAEALETINPDTPEEVKAVLRAACGAAREALIYEESDRKFRETGIIQSMR